MACFYSEGLTLDKMSIQYKDVASLSVAEQSDGRGVEGGEA